MRFSPLTFAVLLCVTIAYGAESVSFLAGDGLTTAHPRSFMKNGQPAAALRITKTGDQTNPASLSCSSGSPDGINEVNIYKITNLVPGKRYMLHLKLSVGSCSDKASVACRVAFLNAAGKHIVNMFSPRTAVTENGAQDFLYDFQVPPESSAANVTIWLSGVKQTEINRIHLGPDAIRDNADGNLLLNGSFETPTMADYYIVTKKGAANVSNNPALNAARSRRKVADGKYALCCQSDFPDGTIEINMNCLPFVAGARQRLAARYFIENAEGKNRISGRFTFWDRNNKVLGYQFPEWASAAGQWHDMRYECFPPAETARVTVTLWFSGKQKLYLDSLFFGASPDKPGKSKFSGTVLRANNRFILWSEAAYRKVKPDFRPPAKPESGNDGIKITLARNESEPIQLVVTPLTDLKNLQLLFSELKNAAGQKFSGNLSAAVVGFVNLRNPDNPQLKGWNADPILPTSTHDAQKGDNLPFYITVRANADCPPGVYRGSIELQSGDVAMTQIPLTVQIRSFALPETAHLRTYFYARPYSKNYLRHDQRPTAEIRRDLLQTLRDHRMNGDQALWPARPRWQIADGELKITDWSEFDRSIADMTANGMCNIPAPVFTMMGDNDGWWGGERDKPGDSPFAKVPYLSPEGLKYAGQFARQFTAYVAKKYPGVKFYAYIYDEPPAKVRADLKILLDALHKAAPQLNTFITKSVTDEIGHVSTWCVPCSPGFVNPAKQAEVIKNGGDIWYYNWQVRMDDFDYIRNRAFAWMIYVGDGNGGLLWDTINCRADSNPWDALDKTHSCGGATIFYPPRGRFGKIVPSMRSAQIKEGIDDFDYMRILERKIDALYPSMGRRAVKDIIGAFMPDMFTFVNDPDMLYAMRNRLGDAIEDFSITPGVAIFSQPHDNGSTELSTVKLTVAAPRGAVISINGQTQKTSPGQAVNQLSAPLPKIGENIVNVTVASNGATKNFRRTYIRHEAQQLRELRRFAADKDVAAFLAGLRSGEYGTAEQQKTLQLLRNSRMKQVKNALRQTSAQPLQELAQAMRNRAEQCVKWELFERAEYYIALAHEADGMKNAQSGPVKCLPAEWHGHAGFIVDNGTLRAVLLECGGRVASLRYKGVELLSPGNNPHILPPRDRAAKAVSPAQITKLQGYGGYEDAGGDGVWPISFVDWDVEFIELSGRNVCIRFSTLLPGTPFKFSRTVSLRENSPSLVMEIEAANTLSKGQDSDDPEHSQLAWRGRIVPAIGDNGAAANSDDRLSVVLTEGKLPATDMDGEKNHYELRSVRLGVPPRMAAWDDKLRTGLEITGSRELTHGYVWFDNKSAHKIYTLEFPRSFYGKRHNDPQANRPFTLKGGESVNFTLTLSGVTK